ncbi:MAG TPA: DUF4783 domain-containing protein [Bacteroidia bacterium]|nr:DUF4783 domain-containing protein [Bacteroidia bacterium]HNU33590.1 DUF4783 domain-containing protein [Bacteroidia bacterium]
MNLKLFVTVLMMCLASLTFAFNLQGIFEDVSNAIRNGDAKGIARYFNGNVDLTIINQEDVYSKAQAEMVLRDFFLKNSVKSFTVVHNGVSKEGDKYVIGTMATSQGVNYRTYFYVKKTGNISFIQEMRFERELQEGK